MATVPCLLSLPAVFAFLGLLVFGAATAAASTAPTTFAEFGSGAGQVNTPLSIGVYRGSGTGSGDVYVADNENIRVDKFDANGNFLLAWGVGVANASVVSLQTCGPEASPPTSQCFKGSTTATVPGSGRPQAIAVDQSTGDVYVREAARVEKYTSTGQFLLMFGKNVDTTPGTSHPNLCTAANLAAGDTCVRGTTSTTEAGTIENGTGQAMAVDANRNLWVGVNNRLEEFNSDGTFNTQITLTGAGQTRSLVLDSQGHFYIKSSSLAGIRKLAAGTGSLLETLDAGSQAASVTLDGAGNVYIGDKTAPYRFLVFNPAGQQTYQFGAGQVIGNPDGGTFGGNALAVGDSAKALYSVSTLGSVNSAAQRFAIPGPGPLVGQQHAENVLPTTATLAGTLNPENHATTYFFEYGTDGNYGHSTAVQPLAASGFEEKEVKAAIDHLLPETTYHFRLVATNHCNSGVPTEECTDRGEGKTFTTLPPAAIEDEHATDVAAASATFRAEINPIGVPATWWVEYGPGEGYGFATPVQSLGSGFGAVPVEAAVSGLLADTAYHYRFVARDERDGAVYTVAGPDRTVTTQAAGLDFRLADDRAWELVSPPDKHGAKVESFTPLQAAADGEGVTYTTVGSLVEDPEGSRAPEQTSALSRRSTPAEWRSNDLAPPSDHVSATLFTGQYKLFSRDLSRALLEPRSGIAPLSPDAYPRTPYLRFNAEPEPSRYQALVTRADVPAGTQGGEFSLVGANHDLTHVVFTSTVPLAPGAPPAPNRSLYVWSGGHLQPLSVLPASQGGGIVATDLVGSGSGSLRHAISDDGSRIFWSTGKKEANGDNEISGLYLRDTGAGETTRLDVVHGGTGTGVARPTFQGASADGTVVFFTDSQHLTAGAGGSGFDLYRCEIPAGQAPSGCTGLTDLTSQTQVPGESAEVQGIAPGIADDGNAAYFVAKGVLDGVPGENGQVAAPGKPNLYVWQNGKGVRFIATLSPEDLNVWGFSHAVAREDEFHLSTAGSPSGRYLAFMSQRSLTGSDNLDAASGEPVDEVYRYDAALDHLDCVSCKPTGAAPDGERVPGGASAGEEARPLVDKGALWKGTWVAALVPRRPIKDESDLSFYTPRFVLDNGRVFFNSIDSLVPADSNRQWDVYQYEGLAAGDCTASPTGASVVRSARGCVSLISSGTAEEETGFLDADPSGDDVFFITSAQLNETDQDRAYDVYDARVNGVPGALRLASECLGEACQPAVQPPNDPTPASAAFAGAGNVKQAGRHCRHGRRKARHHGKTVCARPRHPNHHRHKRHRPQAGNKRGSQR